MKLPSVLTLDEIQTAFRIRDTAIQPYLSGNPDMNGRRLTNAGPSISPFDYVTKFELDAITKQSAATTDKVVSGLLNADTIIRVGAYATRGAAVPHNNEAFFASDRDYVGFVSTGGSWVYACGVHRDAIASRPTPTAAEVNYPFFATDTFQRFYWTGAAWVEEIAPAFVPFLGLTTSFPAWKRSSAIIQARLADDSAYTDVEVLETAYGSGWNGSQGVPTKNAVYDKIETVTAGETAALVSDAVYGSGWNGVGTIAPSKNAVYDKLESLGLETAWTAWVPTYSSSAGNAATTFTGPGTVTTTLARYKVIGKTAFVSISFQATLNAVTPAQIYASLPIAPLDGQTLTPAIISNAGTFETGIVQADNSGNRLTFDRAALAAFGSGAAIDCRCSMVFELA